MKTKSMGAMIFLLATSVNLVAGQAVARDRYVLKYGPGEGKRDFWLWDRNRRKVLWKRHFLNISPENIHWSKDRRAVAIGAGAYPSARVIVWREGEPLRDLGLPRHNEYIMGCVWSPDNQRLLIRVGGSAANYLNYGTLFCLQLRRWPGYKFSELGGARKMAWKSRKTVVFWSLKNEMEPGGSLKARQWRAP